MGLAIVSITVFGVLCFCGFGGRTRHYTSSVLRNVEVADPTAPRESCIPSSF